jgi:excisionase family DNA binding protein
MFDLLSPGAHAALIKLIDERVAQHSAPTTSPQPDSPWLTVAEAATYLRTTPGALYKRISRGQLAAHHPEGSQILLRREDLAPAGPSTAEVL